eukprot:Em0024g25a
MLLYSMGEEAEVVLVSTGYHGRGEESYKKVVEKLDEYFHVRHNVIFERARFNRRDQLEGESGDQYITELYSLAERCSYGQLTSEMIRDRLVVGIRDLALSERLQLNPDLTLEKAKTMIRQREAVHTQQQVLKEAESGSSFKGENSSMDFLRGQGTKTKPAVAELQPDESNLDSAFLDTLTQNSPETWRVKLKLANQTLEFKIDTGAEVIGQFEGELFYRGKTTRQKVYVVNGLRTNLLGLPAILALKLVAKLEETVEASLHTIVEKYPTLFQGLGSMGDPYDIQLQPEAQPYALLPPGTFLYHCVSRSSRSWSEWSHWESSRKSTSQLRGVPEWWSLPRRVYPLPKVDETLAQLAGAKIFSKLDANSGFWQIPLTERSKLLTTFITPFGRYYFTNFRSGFAHGVQADPEKTSAIEGLSSPSNITELRRFLGMANQMGKFSPNLAQHVPGKLSGTADALSRAPGPITNLPQTLEHLKPEWPYLLRFQEQDLEFKSHQKSNYDRHHRVHQLPDIPDQTEVWITTDKSKPTPGIVVGKAGAPRSYIVETQGGLARRNRHHLNVVPNVVRQGAEEPQQPDSLEQEPEQVEKPQQPNTYEQEQDHQPQEPHRIMTRSQTGTAIRPPERFGWNSTLARKGDVA